MQPPALTEVTQHHSLEFYRALVSNSTELIAVLDQAYTYTFAGDSTKDVLGYTPAELLGLSFCALIHPDDQAAVHAALQELLALPPTKFPAFRHRHKEGGWRWLECNGKNLLHQEQVQGLLLSSRDVTTATQLAYELDHHQAYYKSLFHEHPDTVFTIDLHGTIKKVNAHIEQLTGYTHQDLLDRPYSTLLHPDSLKTAAEVMQKVWAGNALTREVNIITKEGATRTISVSIMPVYFRGELQGAQGIAKDITEAVKAQQLIIRMADDVYKHNLDLQQFTYMISHNLRAPVANALGLAQLITKLPKDTANYDTAIEKLQASVEQLDTVVKDINQIVSLRETGRISSRESVYLGQVCRQVLDHFEPEIAYTRAQINLEIDPSYRLMSIQAYLYGILYNLISNCLKYRSDNRQLEITLRAERDKRGYVLTIQDNGTGMDMHLVRHQLFQLYKRFHPNTHGKGIGLFLVKTQVQALSGKIEVESAPEQGTTVKIYLGAKHV